jgi:hypothetical protein
MKQNIKIENNIILSLNLEKIRISFIDIQIRYFSNNANLVSLIEKR